MPFKEDVFDALVSYYAIIHVPRQQHSTLLIDFHRILKTGGLALLCLGIGDLPEDTADYLGTEMLWSHYDKEINLRMMKQSGFSLLWSRVVEDPIDAHAAHLFVLVQKVYRTDRISVSSRDSVCQLRPIPEQCTTSC